MSSNAVADPSLEIGRRFHRPPVPSIVARPELDDPVVFSHVSSAIAMPAPTLAPPIENTFAIHVHHSPLTAAEVWIDGRHMRLPPVSNGGIFIFDLRTEPIAQIHEAFEFSRFQFSRATLDDLAYERGLRRVGDLRAATCDPDPVIQHLALAMLHRIQRFGAEHDTIFADAIALALFDHVARAYGGAHGHAATAGVLAPWQIRRVTEWVDAHLGQPISIGGLSGLIDLSPSYFSRTFVRSFGIPPHRWLLQRRIDRAKALMTHSDATLADIAAACGFVDQSHFTKVFSGIVRATPSAWRRRAR
jgi:AraC-like DNA-binding protein